MNALIIDIIKDIFGENVNSFSKSEYSIKGNLLGILKIDFIDQSIYKELKLSYQIYRDVTLNPDTFHRSEFKLPLLKNQPLEEIVIPFVTGVKNLIQDIDTKYKIIQKVDKFLISDNRLGLLTASGSTFTYKVVGKYNRLVISLDPTSILVEYKNKTRAFAYEFTEELKDYLTEKINE